jgi:hypothetical protein
LLSFFELLTCALRQQDVELRAAEFPFMDLTECFCVSRQWATTKENNSMRKMILGAASALTLASPAAAADLPVTPYTEAPSYERHTYEYRAAPPLVTEQPAPIVSETVLVRRPVVVAPSPPSRATRLIGAALAG